VVKEDEGRPRKERVPVAVEVAPVAAEPEALLAAASMCS
jgi:hypothetical protein